MPRVKLAELGRKDKFYDLRTLINGVAKVEGLEAEEVGRFMGMGRTSAYTYLKNPERLPLNKLLKLCHSMGIPLEKVLECMKY